MERSMRHRLSWTACPSWLMAQQASLSCELTEGARGGFPAWRKKHERTILCAFIRSVSFEHVHVSIYKFFIHSVEFSHLTDLSIIRYSIHTPTWGVWVNSGRIDKGNSHGRRNYSHYKK